MNIASESSLVGRGLTCVRGDRRVFDGVDFAVAPGGALVLTGPNGSGKSSLLRLVAGFLEPAAGTLAWDGVDIATEAEAHRARLSYIGHLDAVKPTLSVADNLAFWARLRDAAGDGAKAAEALDRLAIAHLAEIPAQLLSAGQRRRLSLARLVAAPTLLWLLDEPTVTLDEASVAVVESLIAAHRAAGGLVVVATHVGLDLPGAETLYLGEAP